MDDALCLEDSVSAVDFEDECDNDILENEFLLTAISAVQTGSDEEDSINDIDVEFDDVDEEDSPGLLKAQKEDLWFVECDNATVPHSNDAQNKTFSVNKNNVKNDETAIARGNCYVFNSNKRKGCNNFEHNNHTSNNTCNCTGCTQKTCKNSQYANANLQYTKYNKCLECGKSFPLQSTLRKHLFEMHGISNLDRRTVFRRNRMRNHNRSAVYSKFFRKHLCLIENQVEMERKHQEEQYRRRQEKTSPAACVYPPTIYPVYFVRALPVPPVVLNSTMVPPGLLKNSSAPQIPFLCGNCGLNFTSKNDLISHLNSHKTEGFGCNKCGLVFQNVELFNEHYTRHINDCTVVNSPIVQTVITDALKCKLCSLCFTSGDEYTKHVRQHIESKDHYKCYDCEEVFEYEIQWQSHMDSHTTESLSGKKGEELRCQHSLF